ncbi:GNAT family N-acetyltransferase [Bacillus massiliigorillae]|uniref:GNAT family N-acetyltransferase n=1 Tax=Bacillus massiliigorillae TaxID=1243664 RepID=UPI00039F8B65|nr:GNAT family N-acetyltransferase [Bacillus massiliigorillae]
MITFEPITEETLYIAKEILNSNHDYNILENGSPNRSDEQVKEELQNDRSTSVFIKADDTYIGVIDYLLINPKDQTTWIGLFMIHNDYHGFGYGLMAYTAFEEVIKTDSTPKLRLAILEKNIIAKNFWERVGYSFYDKGKVKENIVDCYEKILSV